MNAHPCAALLAMAAISTALFDAQIEAETTPMEERALGVTVGTRVQTPEGEQIGSVKDLLQDPRTGRPGYVLIARRSGSETAVPYPAIFEVVQNGRIVLEQSQLEHAPGVRESEIQDLANTQWQEQADEYWKASPSDAKSDQPRAGV